MDASRMREKLITNAERTIFDKSTEFSEKGQKTIKISPGSLATILDVPYYKLQRHQVMRGLSNKYDSMHYMSYKGLELDIENYIEEYKDKESPGVIEGDSSND